jgi:hypothetical protein
VCRSTYACLMAAAPVSTTSVSKITRPAPWKEASGEGGVAEGGKAEWQWVREAEQAGGLRSCCEPGHFEPAGRPAATSWCAASGLAAPGWEAGGSGWAELPQPAHDARLLGCRRPPVQARFVRRCTPSTVVTRRGRLFPARGRTGAAKRARTARKRASSPPAQSSSTACTAKPSEQRPWLERKDESEG